MRLVIQRVTEAQVTVAGELVGQISAGVCVLIGIGASDDEAGAIYLADKLARLRIFEDEQEKMNRSVVDTKGEILVVSQFTLYGDVRKGNRPSFSEAAPPEKAERLYQVFVERLKTTGLKIATGQFQEKMEVALKNDGPVTLILDNG